MKIVYLKSFLNDIKKLKDQKLKGKLRTVILEIKQADSLDGISQIKKMKGYSIAYRARIGDYRMGVYKESEAVELARFVKRNDIYKVFPKKGSK